MKKILMVFVLISLIGGVSYADRNITINKVKRIHGEIFLGPKVRLGNDRKYFPIGITVRAEASSDDGFSITIASTAFFGESRDTAYTPVESWDILPNALKPIFRHVYLEAINVDLSQ